MSLKYKFNQGAEPPPLSAEANAQYESEGMVRNVCFIQPDGKRHFLNYAYLIGGELAAGKESIALTFSTHAVTLKGYRLETLFNDLATHMQKNVTAIDERYAATIETGSHVTEITVKAL
ncbi:MAG: hypothetical protein KDD67_03235 [Ignavibacteriae bacterium]|nr:hypothetical protein [Ignavibacteriota bacterium]MCB9217155.1 hypothetical protein [Ignavibacteria bacterium]